MKYSDLDDEIKNKLKGLSAAGKFEFIYHLMNKRIQAVDENDNLVWVDIEPILSEESALELMLTLLK